MLSLLAIYIMGRNFFLLAKEYNKMPWLMAFVGIAVYYASQVGWGILISDILSVQLSSSIPIFGDTLLSFGMGLLTTWVVYKVLERSWKGSKEELDSEILDGGINDEL